jgi:lysylphosphatidylglycerol synthetase-like protein (DUF2156 family)
MVALVSVLVLVSWLGRRPGMFGPVGHESPARLVRTGGYLLVGTMAVAVLVSMRSHDNPDEQARNAVPIFTVVLTTYLLGFLAVSARRCAADRRALSAAGCAGVGAAGLWVTAALSAPPIPASTGLALVLTCTAAVVAASAGAGRRDRPQRDRNQGDRSQGDRAQRAQRDRAQRGMLAALCAATFAALLIVMLVLALSSYGPPGLIPDLAPAALTPADDLAQSRIEVVDPYVGLLLLGCLLAVALSIASITTGRQAPASVEAV